MRYKHERRDLIKTDTSEKDTRRRSKSISSSYNTVAPPRTVPPKGIISPSSLNTM